MIDMSLQKKLMLILSYSLYILWWVVCSSTRNVCIHFFFQIYIFTWYIYPSTSILPKKNHIISWLTCYFKNKVYGSISIHLSIIMMNCFSFFMQFFSSLLLPYKHLHFIISSINIISRPNKYILSHDW